MIFQDQIKMSVPREGMAFIVRMLQQAMCEACPDADVPSYSDSPKLKVFTSDTTPVCLTSFADLEVSTDAALTVDLFVDGACDGWEFGLDGDGKPQIIVDEHILVATDVGTVYGFAVTVLDPDTTNETILVVGRFSQDGVTLAIGDTLKIGGEGNTGLPGCSHRAVKKKRAGFLPALFYLSRSCLTP